MKAKVIKIEEYKDNIPYTTKVTIGTPIGQFIGEAVYNPEHDKTPYSPITGGIIAESRAYIKYLEALMKDRESQIKGLHRLQNAMPHDKEGYIYARRLSAAIFKEWLEFYEYRSGLLERIENIYRSKKIVLNSLDKDKKEEQAKIRKDLQNELDKLKKQLEEDKND